MEEIGRESIRYSSSRAFARGAASRDKILNQSMSSSMGFGLWRNPAKISLFEAHLFGNS